MPVTVVPATVVMTEFAVIPAAAAGEPAAHDHARCREDRRPHTAGMEPDREKEIAGGKQQPSWPGGAIFPHPGPHFSRESFQCQVDPFVVIDTDAQKDGSAGA